jgi:hypothetical protein
MVWALVSVLPEVCEQGPRHTGAADNEPLVVFVQHLEIHTGITIKVLCLIAVGYQLEKVIETYLVLGNHYKVATAVERIELLLSVLVLHNHSVLFFLLLLGVSLVLLIHCAPLTMGLNEVGFASVDGSEVFVVRLHLLQVLHLIWQAVHVPMIGESVGIHPVLKGEVHMFTGHS